MSGIVGKGSIGTSSQPVVAAALLEGGEDDASYLGPVMNHTYLLPSLSQSVDSTELTAHFIENGQVKTFGQ